MGIALSSLIEAKEADLEKFRNKTIVIDSFNILYQFLTTIRGHDGAQLTDSKGNITSHLVGLFGRTTNLMQKQINLAFVFDGKPPELKKKTQEQRRTLKQIAEQKLKEATKKENIEDMKKYSARTTKLTSEMIEESKKLLGLLGIPIIQAPSEGEAQASYMVSKGDAYAVGSQDFDSLIHNATRLVRNLSITGKKKKGAFGYTTVKPEIIELGDVLNTLGIDHSQLIALSMMVGTDYNLGGIKGIGPKNALKIVKKHGDNLDKIFKETKWDEHFDYGWEEVYYTIKKMPVEDNYDLRWEKPDVSGLKKFLVEERDFSSDRITSTIEKLEKETSKKSQMSLADF